ncbi:MAG: SDR family oxidoreductase [Caulobacteraceae bacterium]|nr:SDR family oxidoreductase [Caulobacteraceae bacterium]
MAGRLAGKVALVFGGGASAEGWGNGKASAVLMAREGARVMVADVNPAAAADTVRLIAEEGGEAENIACDVGETADIVAAVDACHARFGALHVLLNNVGTGGGPGTGLFGQTEAHLDKAFAVNVRSVFTAAKRAVPIMVEQGDGRIVNVASTAGLRIMSNSFGHAYALTKAAVIHLTRTIGLEFASQGVRCNSVTPGMIDTPYASSGIRSNLGDAEAERVLQRRHAVSPTGAQGSPWDIAHAVLFLASDESRYVNAANLVVDGGFTWSTPIW